MWLESFLSAYVRFRLAYMYIVLWLAKRYIMLLAVSFALGIGFSGLLSLRPHEFSYLLFQNATEGHSTTENTGLQ